MFSLLRTVTKTFSAWFPPEYTYTSPSSPSWNLAKSVEQQLQIIKANAKWLHGGMRLVRKSQSFFHFWNVRLACRPTADDLAVGENHGAKLTCVKLNKRFWQKNSNVLHFQTNITFLPCKLVPAVSRFYGNPKKNFKKICLLKL